MPRARGSGGRKYAGKDAVTRLRYVRTVGSRDMLTDVHNLLMRFPGHERHPSLTTRGLTAVLKELRWTYDNQAPRRTQYRRLARIVLAFGKAARVPAEFTTRALTRRLPELAEANRTSTIAVCIRHLLQASHYWRSYHPIAERSPLSQPHLPRLRPSSVIAIGSYPTLISAPGCFLFSLLPRRVQERTCRF